MPSVRRCLFAASAWSPTFDLELETPQGRQQMQGRATEVFERRGGSGVHPGRHMDTTDPDA